jgi:hypothetical protein
MRLPLIVTLMGYVGLIPFVIGPLWLTIAPGTVPYWLDRAWLQYVTLIAAFLAGTFWGFALPAIEGPSGILGLFIASVLLVLTWVTMVLGPGYQLYMLAVVFLLQLLADFWRERTLDTIPGYFRLRASLTAGAIVAIAWRLALA